MHIRFVPAFLHKGFELFAIILQNSVSSLYGSSFVALYFSTIFPRYKEYSMNNLALFFLGICIKSCFNNKLGSIISKLELSNSRKLSFNLGSVILS